jgi:coenzyme F420 hydrogenase subunit beta
MVVLDIEDIVTNGMCSGCGICASLDTDEILELTKTRSGHLRPRFMRSLHDRLPARAGSSPWIQTGRASSARARLNEQTNRVCPGVAIPAPPAPAVQQRAPLDSAIWGPGFSLAEGYSSDAATRHKAATGGVLTELSQFLLDSGAVDAICHCSSHYQGDAMLDGPQVSADSATVFSKAGSRYGPAAPLAEVMQLLDKGVRFAVVGKPCDIGAMRRLALVDERVDKLVPYMLSIFCEGPTDLHTMRKIAKKVEVATLAEVSQVQYRGDGCPGLMTLTTSEGKGGSLTFNEAWFDPAIPWTMQWRCKTCGDSIGLHADLVAFDIWPDQLPKGEDLGFNYILTRTPKGETLFQQAVAARKLTLTERVVDYDIVNRAQPQHFRRRTGALARSLACRAAGVPTTAYPGALRLVGAAAAAGPWAQLENFGGALRRLLQGANAESLEAWADEADDSDDAIADGSAGHLLAKVQGAAAATATGRLLARVGVVVTVMVAIAWRYCGLS